jgi:hypothetical protein
MRVDTSNELSALLGGGLAADVFGRVQESPKVGYVGIRSLHVQSPPVARRSGEAMMCVIN